MCDSTRYIFLQGGLGNQMFQYAFYLAQKNKAISVKCDISMILHQNQHNGYELERLFGIYLSADQKVFLLLRSMYYCTVNKQKLIYRIAMNMLKKMKYKLFMDIIPSVYIPTLLEPDGKRLFLLGYWQTEYYFSDIRNEILHVFHFNETLLSSNTEIMKSDIMSCESVSIHVRRGDYLSEENKDMYGGICTAEYYQKAINLILEKLQTPIFYVFSNDMDWVRKNLDVPNPVFVDFNQGVDSWQDMFLMSQCKHNIIANSSFSWWGAWLNQNPTKIVISPSRFINSNYPSDIIPEAWIRL